MNFAEELLTGLEVHPSGEAFEGKAPEWWGPFLFGGFIVGQAVHAVGQTIPEGRRIHSLHAYFLLPVRAALPIRHVVSTLRDGRTFSQRQLRSEQEGETVFVMTCSFVGAPSEPSHELTLDAAVPGPEGLAKEAGRGPWPEVARVGPGRAWCRLPSEVPADPRLNDALLGFISDLTGGGGQPFAVPDVTNWVSLDHAVWFHRPLVADEWLLFDPETVAVDGKRGLLRGSFYGSDRCLRLSMTQEALLRTR